MFITKKDVFHTVLDACELSTEFMLRAEARFRVLHFLWEVAYLPEVVATPREDFLEACARVDENTTFCQELADVTATHLVLGLREVIDGDQSLTGALGGLLEQVAGAMTQHPAPRKQTPEEQLRNMVCHGPRTAFPDVPATDPLSERYTREHLNKHN